MASKSPSICYRINLQGIPADPEKRLVDFLLENMLMNPTNDPLPNDVAGKG